MIFDAYSACRRSSMSAARSPVKPLTVVRELLRRRDALFLRRRQRAREHGFADQRQRHALIAALR